MIERRSLVLGAGALAGVLALPGCSRPAESGAVRIGMVAKSLGNNFFNAVHRGADEAAATLGDVEIIFTGPPTATAEGQIEVLNGLIAQRVNAIAVSANDPDALAPTLKRAAERGVKVMSYDSAVAEDARLIHLAASSDPLIGQTCIDLAAAAAPNGAGKIAILSATPTSTNQNTWIAEMRRVLPSKPGLELVGVVYGDDLVDKSYRETLALLRQHPDLSVIVAPTSVAIVAAAKAVEDRRATGRVFVTGLGLPSELAGHVRAGSVKSFALWNPIDLGFAAATLAVAIARGAEAGPSVTMSMGRVGEVTFDEHGVGPMGRPTVFDGSNIDQFADVF